MTRVTVVTVHQDENETAALLRLAELGVRLPTLQDGQRRIAAALGVPNVMPATVVLRADGSVAKVLPQAFTSADEIAAAVEQCTLMTGVTPVTRWRYALTPELRPPWLAPLVENVDRVPHAYRRKVPPELLAAVTGAGTATPVRTRRRGAGAVLRTAPPTSRPDRFPTTPTCC